MDRPSVMVLVPCGHLCVCHDCSRDAQLRCPICRTSVAQMIRTYASWALTYGMLLLWCEGTVALWPDIALHFHMNLPLDFASEQFANTFISQVAIETRFSVRKCELSCLNKLRMLALSSGLNILTNAAVRIPFSDPLIWSGFMLLQSALTVHLQKNQKQSTIIQVTASKQRQGYITQDTHIATKAGAWLLSRFEGSRRGPGRRLPNKSPWLSKPLLAQTSQPLRTSSVGWRLRLYDVNARSKTYGLNLQGSGRASNTHTACFSHAFSYIIQQNTGNLKWSVVSHVHIYIYMAGSLTRSMRHTNNNIKKRTSIWRQTR